MKTIFHALAILMIAFFTSCSSEAQTTSANSASLTDRIEVLDFHTDHRCQTCLKIEQLTKQVLNGIYANEMSANVITFQLINVDEDENFPLAQKFGAFGTSLILNIIHQGEEKYIDLTDFAFMNAGDEEKFSQGLREQVNTALKNLQ